MIENQANLERHRVALLIVDVQEKLAASMGNERLAQLERNIGILTLAACEFGLPVVLSEQYPKGLGKTLESLESGLSSVKTVHRLEKTAFSVCGDSGFGEIAKTVARDQWLVVGMETHVCVYQTARDLVGQGGDVHVVADAVCSRTEENWKIGMKLCRRAGAVHTSTEAVVFDLLGDASGSSFKTLSRAIR